MLVSCSKQPFHYCFVTLADSEPILQCQIYNTFTSPLILFILAIIPRAGIISNMNDQLSRGSESKINISLGKDFYSSTKTLFFLRFLNPNGLRRAQDGSKFERCWLIFVDLQRFWLILVDLELILYDFDGLWPDFVILVNFNGSGSSQEGNGGSEC